MIINNQHKICIGNFPEVKMGYETLKYVNSVKYLGHVICSNLYDNDDIDRQVKSVYIRGNTLFRKFNKCEDEVKCKLFQAYCTNLYCSSLWCTFTLVSMDRLRVAYNNTFRLLLNLPRWCSASGMFSLTSVPSFSAIMRRHKYSLLNRLQQSSNLFVSALIFGDNRCTSKLLKTVYKSLYVI